MAPGSRSAHTLAGLKSGDTGEVVSIDVDFAVRERLAALGLRVGRTVRLVRRVGKHGPLQVRSGTADLILRPAEAAKIHLRALAPDALAPEAVAPPAGSSPLTATLQCPGKSGSPREVNAP